MPFKTPSEATLNHHPQEQTTPLKTPQTVGGQAAYDFISSYEVPASGLPFAASGPSFNIAKDAPSSAVETLREILNKNIPYTDHQNAIDVQYSDQSLDHNNIHQQQPTHFDTNQEQYPATEYGAPSLSPHSTSSLSSSFGGFGDELSSHGTPQQQNAPSAPGLTLEVPHSHSNKNQFNNFHSGADSNPVQQYEIPPDPHTYVPAFKPLSKAPLLPYPVTPVRYGAPLQPLYHSHSVHTAYGAPAVPVNVYRRPGTNPNNNHHGGVGGGASDSSFGGPSGAPYKGNMYLPPLGPPPSQAYGPPAGNYNRRTFNNPPRHLVKLHGKRANWFFGGPGKFYRGNGAVVASRNAGTFGHVPSSPILPTNTVPVTTPSALLKEPIVVADQQLAHVVQSDRQKDDFGVDIEVQQSIGYELDAQGNAKKMTQDSPALGQTASRRSDNALRPVDGPIYSRPYSRQRQTPKLYTFHRY